MIQIPFIAAKNFNSGRHGAPPKCIVIHDMEYPEKTGAAEWCARFFAGENAPQASAHYCVDDTKIFQCVIEGDTAWGAPGMNRLGIHVEHAGYAKQRREDWADPYSEAELRLSAELVADICRRWRIPVRKLGADELRAGESGICGHVDVTDAFKKGDHRDPGPGFPWDHYLDLVAGFYSNHDTDPPGPGDV